jgi:hypothetical protein
MSFDSTWPNATADSTNNESHPPPEPGEYNVTVQDARAFTSKAGNEVMIVEMRVLDGRVQGYVWSDVRGFKSEAAAGVSTATHNLSPAAVMERLARRSMKTSRSEVQRVRVRCR